MLQISQLLFRFLSTLRKAREAPPSFTWTEPLWIFNQFVAFIAPFHATECQQVHKVRLVGVFSLQCFSTYRHSKTSKKKRSPAHEQRIVFLFAFSINQKNWNTHPKLRRQVPAVQCKPLAPTVCRRVSVCGRNDSARSRLGWHQSSASEQQRIDLSLLKCPVDAIQEPSIHPGQ